MPYDLFISYSRRDNPQTSPRITELVSRIKADFAPFAKRELVPFFDQQEIHGMSDWRKRILQGLRESRLLLACLSPAYLQSGYCEWEFVEYLKYEIGHLHGFNGVAPIYFVEVPGWDSKDFEQQCAAWIAELRKRQNFDLRPWHDEGEEALREAAVQERLCKLNHQIAQTITRGERAEKSLGNVDAHNPHFIGRTANLRMLRENFVTPGHIGVVTAVNGVGGLGKTALAIEYAHAFADEYGGGRWQVRCAGKDDLRLALAELATPIGYEFTDDEKKNADLQFERTRRELKKLADARAPHRCLLLLDNVDRPGLLDPAQVARLNGGDWLHVLATTRLGENELHGAHRDRAFLAIDELPPDDALALIESYQPDGRFRSEAERDAAREIVRLLGSFTLAVESAAVYLGQFANDVTCAAFLARLKKEGLEGLDTAASQSDVSVRHGEKRLSATLQPTLERLGATEKLALEFAALLPPDQVPLPWLRTLVAKTFPEMERDAEPGYPDPWKNVLRRLFSLRLLQATEARTDNGDVVAIRVHRIVQHATESHASQSHVMELEGQIFSFAASECRYQEIDYQHTSLRTNRRTWLEIASSLPVADVALKCDPKIRRLLLHRAVCLADTFRQASKLKAPSHPNETSACALYRMWLNKQWSDASFSVVFQERWAHMEFDMPNELDKFHEAQAELRARSDLARAEYLNFQGVEDMREIGELRTALSYMEAKAGSDESLAMLYSCIACIDAQMGNSATSAEALSKARASWHSHFKSIK